MNRIEDAMRCFDTTSKKRLQKIKFTTQHNYEIEGFISKKPNRYLGSIFVTSIDGRACSQLIQGMPKLGYWDAYHHFNDPEIDIRAKEDGTNIAFCALMDEYNESVLDVIVKTRGVPGIADDFKMMLDNLNTSKAYDHIYHYGGTLCFELFGKDNKHEIAYDTDLDLRLLTAFNNSGEQCCSEYLDMISGKIGIERPDKLFYILKTIYGRYCLNGLTRLYGRFEPYIDEKIKDMLFPVYHDNLKGVYDHCGEILEQINKNSINKHVGAVIEGTIWTGQSNVERKSIIQVKCKPKSIKDGHISQNGIPSIFINKAIRKFKDDYPDHEEILKTRPEMIIERVNAELLEDWDKLLIDSPKTQSRIETKMHQILAKKEIADHIVNLAKDLIEKHPGLDSAADYMRIFSQEHPDLRKKSNVMFNALSNALP